MCVRLTATLGWLRVLARVWSTTVDVRLTNSAVCSNTTTVGVTPHPAATQIARMPLMVYDIVVKLNDKSQVHVTYLGCPKLISHLMFDLVTK